MNTQKIEPQKVLNVTGDDTLEARQMWGGNSTGVMQLNSVKYPWAIQIYNAMLGDFWIPEKIDLTDDVVCYRDLTQAERRVYDHILSYLTYLDSIQVTNVPHLKAPFTAPELHIALGFQVYQEALHSKSYQTVIEAIIEAERRDSIYELWRKDKLLLERCEYIGGLYQQFIDNPTPERYFVALVADYLLESLYFYNGFQIFYNFASQQKMSGSCDMIKLINRDEANHVRLYQKIIIEGMQKFPHSQDQILELVNAAVLQECAWTNHITGGEILGIDEESTNTYTRYLANTRLRAIGLPPLYEGASNPYKHLEKIADLSSEAGTKANFFETTVTSYNQSSNLEGWGDF